MEGWPLEDRSEVPLARGGIPASLLTFGACGTAQPTRYLVPDPPSGAVHSTMREHWWAALLYWRRALAPASRPICHDGRGPPLVGDRCSRLTPLEPIVSEGSALPWHMPFENVSSAWLIGHRHGSNSNTSRGTSFPPPAYPDAYCHVSRTSTPRRGQLDSPRQNGRGHARALLPLGAILFLPPRWEARSSTALSGSTRSWVQKLLSEQRRCNGHVGASVDHL